MLSEICNTEILIRIEIELKTDIGITKISTDWEKSYFCDQAIFNVDER